VCSKDLLRGGEERNWRVRGIRVLFEINSIESEVKRRRTGLCFPSPTLQELFQIAGLQWLTLGGAEDIDGLKDVDDDPTMQCLVAALETD